MNIKQAAAAMGSIGGKNGVGESKRRNFEHYSRIAKIGWQNRKKPIEQRFWEKVDKRGEDECWPWTEGKNKKGYGDFRVGKKMIRAHRMAYELHYGEKPKDCILHKCDNPPCCNPNHLFQGTNQDNISDCVAKNRRKYRRGPFPERSGEKCGRAKLTNEQVLAIRAMDFSKLGTKTRVARMYGVTMPIITCILSRKTWKYI